jgi:hypothetical protein
MCPWKLDMDRCLGYNLKEYKDSFLMLKIIKNRLSRDNISFPLLVNPKALYFEELN